MMALLLNDLAMVYDREYEAVEAARNAWLAANDAVLKLTLPALDAAVRDAGLRSEPAALEDHSNPHRRFSMVVVRPEGRTGVSLRLRCARPYGGPGGVLRIILRFRDAAAPTPPTPRSLVFAAVDSLPDPLPGEAWSQARHPDISPDDRPLRVSSVALSNLETDAFSAAVRREAHALLRDVGIPVVARADARLRGHERALQALSGCEAQVAEVVGDGDWDLHFQPRGGGPLGSQIVSIENDYTDVGVGVDPELRLYVTARNDTLLRAVAIQRGTEVVPSPADPAYGVVLLGSLAEEPDIDVGALVVDTMTHWVRAG